MTLILPRLPYDPEDPREQGGILLGLGSQVHLATAPMPADVQHPDLLMLLDPGHQAAADARPDLDYLGYWHSHPTAEAVPSEMDLTDWQTAVEHIGAPLYFPIFGSDGLRVYCLSPGQRHPQEVTWTYSTQN